MAKKTRGHRNFKKKVQQLLRSASRASLQSFSCVTSPAVSDDDSLPYSGSIDDLKRIKGPPDAYVLPIIKRPYDLDTLRTGPSADCSTSTSGDSTEDEGQPLKAHLPLQELLEARQTLYLLGACGCFLVAGRGTLWWALVALLRPSLSIVSFTAGVGCLMCAFCSSPQLHCLSEPLEEFLQLGRDLVKSAPRLLKGDLLEAILSIDRGVAAVHHEIKGVHRDTSGIRAKVSWLPVPSKLAKEQVTD
eukprot:jgi/Botrbrau1/513/Bobra.110_2s0142.1